jgi:arylsulfatase A-like enzyme
MRTNKPLTHEEQIAKFRRYEKLRRKFRRAMRDHDEHMPYVLKNAGFDPETRKEFEEYMALYQNMHEFMDDGIGWEDADETDEILAELGMV